MPGLIGGSSTSMSPPFAIRHSPFAIRRLLRQLPTGDSPMTRPQAVPTVQIDNDRVKVTEWRFAPGAETGHHQHGMDYVVVPLTSGVLRLETAQGVFDNPLIAGQSYTRLTGVEHNVINAGEQEFAFIEIELK
jgi:quercetin dioxygenase-like cupin family protein